jgi:hypothetical protein
MYALLLAFSLLAQAALKPEDTAANDALEKFKSDYKAKESSARASAVLELGKTQHEKVVARVGQVLTSPDDKDVRIAAAKALGGGTEYKKKSAQVLIAAIGPNQKDSVVVAAILEALGKLGDQVAVGTVESEFKSKDVAVLKAAVEAAEGLGSRSSVPLLIDLLKRLEEGAKTAPNPGGGGGYGGGKYGGLGGGSGVTDAMAQEREKVVKPVVHKALASLTKASHAMAKEWEDWWRTEGGKYLSGR